jgi:uncharacterized lipoprotein YajG
MERLRDSDKTVTMKNVILFIACAGLFALVGCTTTTETTTTTQTTTKRSPSASVAPLDRSTETSASIVSPDRR